MCVCLRKRERGIENEWKVDRGGGWKGRGRKKERERERERERIE